MQVNGHVYPEIDKYNFGESFKNPRLVYKNLGNGKFKDVSAEMGPGITARYSSRGAAFGDYDNDGGMDILILNMNELPSLLHNVGGQQAELDQAQADRHQVQPDRDRGARTGDYRQAHPDG